MTEPDPSRVEAAEAGAHHEAAEEAHHVGAREHVTAADAAMAPVHPHHHPDDPNATVVRATAPSPAGLAVAVAVAVLTLVALAAVGYAIARIA